MKILAGLVLALSFWAPVVLAQTITIVHARLIDVVNGSVQPDTTVVISGNRIVHVSRGSATDSHAAGRVVDARGEYLIPGLWDMHTHVYDQTDVERSELTIPLFIANGITGIRDMGSGLEAAVRGRQEIAAHRLLGPRMVVSGPMLDGPKTPYKAAIALTTAEDGRKAVDLLKRGGADFVKVQSGVPREAYFGVAAEAKKDGIEFEGHVPDAIRASEAVAAGQKSFEHLIGIFEASSPDEDRYLKGDYFVGTKAIGMFLKTYDPAREKKIIDLLAKNHVWQCPTLYWERGQWLVDVIDTSKDPDLGYAAKSWVVTQWPAARKSILSSLDKDPVAVRRQFVEHELAIVKKLHEAGVPFLAGTDTPAGVDVIPGVSLHHELERFVAAGFTPLEALQTATLNPAKFLNKTKDFGTIEAGKVADLVLLKENPLVDIRNTRTIAGVVADGRYLSDADLTALRGRLKALAATR